MISRLLLAKYYGYKQTTTSIETRTWQNLSYNDRTTAQHVHFKTLYIL